MNALKIEKKGCIVNFYLWVSKSFLRVFYLRVFFSLLFDLVHSQCALLIFENDPIVLLNDSLDRIVDENLRRLVLDELKVRIGDFLYNKLDID